MTFHETKFLLSERNNRNSAVRANGFRWWGYPSRRSPITCIVLHTTENSPGPGVAMNVARWQANVAPSPSSYHKLVDTRDIVQTVDDNHTAFHAVGFNSNGLGVSFATQARRWGQDSSTDLAMLHRGAWVAAEWAIKHDIPVRWITRAQGATGVKGFITHANVDPARRSDPGPRFPTAEFLRLVNHYITVLQPVDEWEVFLMSLSQAEKDRLQELARYLNDKEHGTTGDSFARQLLDFHRNERPQLQRFMTDVAPQVERFLTHFAPHVERLVAGLEDMNSTALGLARGFPALWREAQAKGWERSLSKYRENRNYSPPPPRDPNDNTS